MFRFDQKGRTFRFLFTYVLISTDRRIQDSLNYEIADKKNLPYTCVRQIFLHKSKPFPSGRFISNTIRSNKFAFICSCPSLILCAEITANSSDLKLYDGVLFSKDRLQQRVSVSFINIISDFICFVNNSLIAFAHSFSGFSS